MPSLLSFFLMMFSAMQTTTVVDDQIDYVMHVKPILKERCYSCHGALKQEGKLRLDTAARIILGGDSGGAIHVGDAAASLLIQRVGAQNSDERMPPRNEGEALTPSEIEILKRWIQKGANAPNAEQSDMDPESHWAFLPIVRPQLPKSNSGWARNELDAFIEEGHTRERLTPQSEAPRIVLLRRLYFDLVGVPPTLEDIQECEKNTSPLWYESVVDRLLSDPRYGERWARHWMDIWRYSDWWGLGDQLRNSQKHIWHWRDWIVESLNEDLPYDEMVRQMLAADELYPNDLRKLRATGFLARNYWLFNRPQWMDETVEHVSKGILGLTMNCARCHDHKYDPIEQLDYYRMRAFFEPYHVRLEMIPGESDLNIDGIPRVFDGVLDEPTYLYVRGDERMPDKTASITPGLPNFLCSESLKIEPVDLPNEAWQPERRPWVFQEYSHAARRRVADAEVRVQTIRQKMDAASSHKKSDQESRSHENSKDPSSGALDAELAEAESALLAMTDELDSILLRIEAHQAEWSGNDGSVAEKTRVAIRSERKSNLSKAKHKVAITELAYVRAGENKKSDLDKKRKEAAESLASAEKLFEMEIASNDRFTRFAGARWTPTRFLNSGKDDPEVLFHKHSTGRRTVLAQWITSQKNPLAARVAVNHIWTRHFGQPLVPSVFDFGRKGITPTHPELLNWLSSELLEKGWSMKHIHRLITTSSTYRMSSSLAGNPRSAEKDSENRFWWRRVPQRIESQSVRDSLLFLADSLDHRMGGPSVPSAEQNKSMRRSLYFFHSNNDRNLFLTQFDEALVKDCYRREQSIVPQQALALINSQISLDTAHRIEKLLSQKVTDDTRFIQEAFALLLGIQPSNSECELCLRAFEEWRGRSQEPVANVRTNFVWALINHNDFVTLR